MLFLLRMLAMGMHFILAGILGLLLGLSRPFNPDNSRLCARLYSLPALWLLRLKLKTEVKALLQHRGACVIVANHQSNYDL
jgi:1-acyl-sn-glycerol-3-phosphate acyltransferase